MTAIPPAGNNNQDMKDLIKALETANKLAEGAKTSRDKAAKARVDARKERKKDSALAQIKRKALVGVNKIQSTTMKQLNSAFESSLKMQEKSLGRGMGLGIVLSETTAQQKQLAGTVTGFGEAVEIGYEQFESGLKSSNAATNQLAAYTKVTGGNSLKLLKGMSKLTRGMSLSTEQETALMSSVQGLSQNYKMTSEELMDSLGGLEQGMRGFKLMGVGAEMSEAGLKISAALGKQGGDMGTRLLETLTSAEGQYTAAALGVTKQRLALLRGEGDATQNALQMVVKAGSIAKDRIDQMVRGGADPAVAIAALEKTMGKGLGDAALVFEQLNKEATSLGISLEEHVKRVGEKQELDNKFNASWNNFVSQVFSPLKETVMKLTTGFLDFISNNKEMAVTIGKVIVGLAALTSAIVTAATARATMKVAGSLPGGKLMGTVMKGLFTFIKRLPFLLFSAFTMIPVFGQILLAIAGIVAVIYYFKDEIGALFSAGWDILKDVGSYVWDAIKWVGTQAWDGIKWLTGVLWEAVSWLPKKIIGGIWEIMKWVASFIWNLPTTLIEGIWGIMKWVGEKIVNAFNFFGEEVKEPKVVTNSFSSNSLPFPDPAQQAKELVSLVYASQPQFKLPVKDTPVKDSMITVDQSQVTQLLGELRDAQLESNALTAQGVQATMNVNKPSPRQAITGAGAGGLR